MASAVNGADAMRTAGNGLRGGGSHDARLDDVGGCGGNGGQRARQRPDGHYLPVRELPWLLPEGFTCQQQRIGSLICSFVRQQKAR